MMFSCERFSTEWLAYQRVRRYRTVSDEKMNGAGLKPDAHLFPSCNPNATISFFACHLQWISELLFQKCHAPDTMWCSHFFKGWHVTPFQQKASLLLRFFFDFEVFVLLVLFALCHFTLHVKCALRVMHFSGEICRSASAEQKRGGKKGLPRYISYLLTRLPLYSSLFMVTCGVPLMGCLVPWR